MKTAATVLFLLAITPMAANAGQVKTPTISTPHVNVRANVSTPNTNIGSTTPKGAGNGTGRVQSNDFHFTKTTDKSSANLYVPMK
jgi:type VI protein secretion system component Hcp